MDSVEYLVRAHINAERIARNIRLHKISLMSVLFQVGMRWPHDSGSAIQQALGADSP